MAGGPGLSERVQSLDIVRGVAVLGILLLNIVSFGMPEAAYFNPRAYGGAQGADLAAYLINFVLFDGKMRGLFSFLFGASMLLVIERAQANGRNPAAVHFARMGWLLVFGLAHLWLVWRGDILAHYALVGMIAFALRGLRPAQMLPLAVMLVLANTLIFAGMPMSVLDLQQPAANAAEAAENARQLHDFVGGFGVPAPADIAYELALYRGGYVGIVRERFARGTRNRLSGVKSPVVLTLAKILPREKLLQADDVRARSGSLADPPHRLLHVRSLGFDAAHLHQSGEETVCRR